MTDGTNSSEILQPIPVERRSFERRSLTSQEQISATKDWVRTQREKVENGILTQDEYDELIARSMVAREKLTERANEKRRKDPMTGRLNKGAYFEEIDKLIYAGTPFGMMIVDIDHFKVVNDTYGHATGDSVLIQTTQNLNLHLRQARPDTAQNDQIFRYGGEEFVVLLPGMHSEEDLEKVSEKIRIAVSASPYSVNKDSRNIHIPVTVSIGGGIYRQERQPELRDAEGKIIDPKIVFFDKVDTKGLYQAKEGGRNKTVIVSP
ncbi:MAG: GGDEF domain-containing protein [Patescibacteria group bacterium]